MTTDNMDATPPHLVTAKRSQYPRVSSGSEKQIRQLLRHAGVEIGGARPWDIQVHNPRVYRRVIADGSLGLGEAYMDGDWDCPAIDQFFHRGISARPSDKLGVTIPLLLQSLSARFQNRQDKRRAKVVADVHYNLPIDIFEATFDSRLSGSCGYRKSARTLDQSQEDKLDLVCRKIGLHSGDLVLDFGCGWGALMGFAAEQYGADCRGVTISSATPCS